MISTRPTVTGLFVWALLPVFAATPLNAQSVAAWLPQDTLLHVEVSGAPCERSGGGLALARALAEPEVREFLKSVEPLIGFAREQGGQALQQAGMSLDDLLTLIKGRLTLSIAGLEDNGDPKIVITAEFKHAKEAGLRTARALVDLIKNENNGELKEITVGGHKGHHLSFPYGAPFVCVYLDHMFVATSNPDLLEGFVSRMNGADTPSLAGTAGWNNVANKIGSPDNVIYAWANVAKALDTFSTMMPVEMGTMFRVTGLNSIQAMGYAFTLEGAGFRDRIFLSIPERQGVFAMLAPKAGTTLTADRIVPAETVMFQTSAMEFGGLLEWFHQIADEMEPGSSDEIRQQMDAMSERLGFDIQDDLLALLGPEISVYAALPGQALIPDAGVLVHMKDENRVKANITRMVSGAFGVPIKSFTYHGTEFNYADIGALGMDWDDMPPLKPTWTVVGDHLLITPWPQAAKNLVRGLKMQTPRLADNDDYQRLLAQVRTGNANAGNGGRAYMDLRRLVGFVMDNGVPFAQSLIPPIPDMPADINWAAFPATEVITKHLFGLVAASTWLEDGVMTEYVSPTGFMPAYTAFVAGFASWTLVAQESAMMEAELMREHMEEQERRMRELKGGGKDK